MSTTNDKWKTGLCSFKEELGKCLLSSFCGYIGIGIVQAQASDIHDRNKVMPCICSSFLCCIGAGYNRTNTRKYLKIKGSYLVDCLIYITPICCCASVQEYNECATRKKDVIRVPPSLPKVLIPVDTPPIVVIRVESFYSIDCNEGVEIKACPTIPQEIFSEEDNINIVIDQRNENKIETEVDDISETSEPEPQNSPSSKEFKEEIGMNPIDGNNPQVYSFVKGFAPFSFLKGDPFQPNCPPPTYMSLEQIQKPKVIEPSEIMQGLEVNIKKGGLVCVDKEALAKQKGIIGEVFKSVVANIAKGLGAVSISLPVRIFEPRSTCERLVDRFSFATNFLTKAGEQRDPVERLKYTMAFAISGLYLGTKQEKPFNPLLGETFQGHFSDGTQVYVEHTAHNPPTDHFDVIGRNYRLFGYYALDGNFSWNDLIGEFRGNSYIQFNDGQVISYTQPKFILGGVMTGDRTLNWEGDLEFQDTSGYSASIRIGDDKHK